MNYSPLSTKLDLKYHGSQPGPAAYNGERDNAFGSPLTTRTGSVSQTNTYGFDYDKPSFEKYQEDKLRQRKPSYKNNAVTAMKGFFCEKNNDRGDRDLSAIFYSPENTRRIQKMIKREVFVRTNGQYKLDENQDDSDLLVAMRAVFMENARFLPFKIISQIKELNRKTVESVVPDMITAMKQTYGYLKDISEPIKPIARPVNVGHAGRKTLPALTTSFGF